MENNIGYGDVIDYLASQKKGLLKQAMMLDMPYFTEKVVIPSSPKEKVAELVDFALNYDGADHDSHLFYWRSLARGGVLNAKVAGIPVIEFAKLNSSQMVDKFISMGATNEETVENSELIAKIASLFGVQLQKDLNFGDLLGIVDKLKNDQTIFDEPDAPTRK